MANKTFNSLVNRLAPHVPGCPYPIIEQYIRDAAIEACERTLAWRYKQPKIRLTPGVYDYPYETPSHTEVHAFITVAVNGRQMQPITLEHLHELFPEWPDLSADQRATPRYISQLDPDNFVIASIPDSAESYDVRMIVALKPLRTATSMDQTVMDDLENVIMHGALQHLMLLPDRDWSDANLAAYHARQYLYKITERRARANLGAARAPMSIQMRPLA